MRVAVVSNHRAGRSEPFSHLHERIERAGHTVVQAVDPHFGELPPFDPSVELVVAAGGDGTVALAARLVAGTELPVAILPLGTANNVARSLGIEGSVRDLAYRWNDSTLQAIDVGVARTARGERIFLESVGGGLVPSVIDSMHIDRPTPAGAPPAAGGAAVEEADEALAAANHRYREVLERLAARDWTIIADGERIEGPFLLVEVMNIERLGPNLRFSPEASARDGLLTIVTVAEAQRDELRAFLHAHDVGSAGTYAFPVRHATTVTLLAGGDVHVDDVVHPWDALGPMEIGIRPGALRVLA